MSWRPRLGLDEPVEDVRECVRVRPLVERCALAGMVVRRESKRDTRLPQEAYSGTIRGGGVDEAQLRCCYDG